MAGWVLTGCLSTVDVYATYSIPKFKDEQLFYELYKNSILQVLFRDENKSKVRLILNEIQKRELDKGNTKRILRLKGLARIIFDFEDISVNELTTIAGEPDEIRNISDNEYHILYIDIFSFSKLQDNGSYSPFNKTVYSLYCVKNGKIYEMHNNFNMKIAYTGAKPDCSI